MSELFVPTHIASDLMFTAIPLAPVPSSTSPLTPIAPMRIEISVGIAFSPSWCSVSSSEPMPASAHAETLALRSIRA